MLRRRRSSLRVVFGRLVFAAVPLVACAPADDTGGFTCNNTCYTAFPSGKTTVTVQGGYQGTGSGNCNEYCPSGMEWRSCANDTSPDAGPDSVECTCQPCFRVGRAPAGLQVAHSHAATPLGRHLAEAAHFEAASVITFEGLANELKSHGAPTYLIRRARAAAQDEVRHARTMSHLAGLHDATPPAVRVDASPERSLEILAIENATEGCVRETYAALIATWQAQTAADPEIRRAMARIAMDETRHAELSWAIARWVDSVLSPEASARVATARQTALLELESSAVRPEDPSIVHDAGWPPPAVAAHLVRGLREEINLRASNWLSA